MRVNFDGRDLLQRILAGFPRLGGEEEPIVGPQGPPGPAGSIPTGMIMIWGGDQSNIPDGYLYCNGAAVSRVTYAALFAKIKTYYGAGDGANTFNIPLFVSRFPFGSNQSQGSVAIPGLQQGNSQHTHGVSGIDVLANNGSHSHSINASGTHNHTAHGTQSNISAMGSQTVVNTAGHSNDGDHSHGGNTGSESASHDHGVGGSVPTASNLCPALNVLYIIKT